MELAERNNDHTPPICQRDQINGHIDSSSSPLIPPSIRIPAGKNSFSGGILSPGPLEVPRDLENSTHCSSQPGFAVGESNSPPTAGSTALFESFVPPSIVPDRSPNSNDDCMVRRLEDRMGLLQLTDLSFSEKWSPIQSLMHINVLELLAVQLTLVRLPRCLSVLVMSDNKTTVAAINRLGSKSADIPKLHHHCSPKFGADTSKCGRYTFRAHTM